MAAVFEHVGIACTDLDRTLAFYRDLLGLKEIVRRTTLDGSEVAFLDAGGGMLEIIRPAGVQPGRAPALAPDAAGIRHLTLRVPDLAAAHAQLTMSGVTFTEAPRTTHNHDIIARVAFCFDPDGIVVELAER